MIFSHLDYCNSVLYGLKQKDLQKLRKVQNSSVRFIYNKQIRKWDHCTPFLKKAHFLPVEFRISFKIALLVFKCINNLAPPYLQELLHLRVPKSNTLRIDNDYFILKQPSNIPNFSMSENAFSYCGPKIWNNLPYEMRSLDTIEKFKANLKTYYFDIAFKDLIEAVHK